MVNYPPVEIIVPIAVFAMVVLIVWIVSQARRHSIQQRAELRRHLLDKFNSGQELTQFLATPQGQSFLKELEIGSRLGSAKQQILRTVRWGILLFLLGIGFWIIFHYGYARHEDDLIIPAVVLVVLGAGFLIAAAVSYWLSKKWGIFEESAVTSQK